MKTLRVMLGMMMASGAAMPVQAASVTPYGGMLEEFSYDYPVNRFDFKSQREKLSMAYLDVAPAEKANGKVVVLLHGKNFCAGTWEQTIHTLSRAGYRVIAPDQIGFCKSTKPPRYQFSFNQLAQNTNALLAYLKIEKAIIIGHSMGGMLGMRYAINYPQHTEQLVLVNPIGLEDWQAKGVPYASIDTLYEAERKTDFDSIKAYQQRMYFDGSWKPEYDRWVGMLAGMYAGNDKKDVAWNQAQASDMIFTQPVIHEVSRIAAPTLFIVGGKDRTAPGSNRATPALAAKLGDYPVLAKEASKEIGNATLVLFPDLGHSPQIEAPDRFHEKLLKGLK